MAKRSAISPAFASSSPREIQPPRPAIERSHGDEMFSRIDRVAKIPSRLRSAEQYPTPRRTMTPWRCAVISSPSTRIRPAVLGSWPAIAWTTALAPLPS